MNRDTENEAADRSYVLQYYVVCLIDVLGQSERLKGWEHLPLDGQPSDQLVSAFAKTAVRVKEFGEMFSDHFRRRSPRVPSETLVRHLSAEQLAQWARMKEAKLVSRQFSDTFLFYSPVVNNRGDVTAAALDPMLLAAALALLTGLAKETPARGAIVVGAGTEIAEGELYGPVLAAADRIEKKIAGYPRVIVSPDAVQLANRESGFSSDPDIEALLRQQSARPQQYLCIDTDGMTIVDFLGADIYSLVGTQPHFRDLVRDAYRFTQAATKRYTAEGNSLLSERYSRLLKYMRPRVEKWGIQS